MCFEMKEEKFNLTLADLVTFDRLPFKYTELQKLQ